MNRLCRIALGGCLLLAAATRLGSQARPEIAVWHPGERAAGDPAVSDNLYAARHAVAVAGAPVRVTSDMAEAVQSAMLLIAPPLAAGALQPAERDALAAFLAAGGVAVAVAVSDPELLPLFGLAAPQQSHQRPALHWLTESGDPALRWFDDPQEKTISLGREGRSLMMTSTGYRPAGAVPLARYDDGLVAAARHVVGAGTAYSLGVAWAEVILLGQLNRDHSAQRVFSNGFEPTADTLLLFVRALYQTHVPHACWTHTAPGRARAALIVTHDVDSRSGLEMMEAFASMEAEHGVRATYNVTTSYVHDSREGGYGGYYTAEAVAGLRRVIDLGGRIGSHSVGHFPDFGDEEIVPEGAPGNTRENYAPYYDTTLKRSFGATVYGELEVSRDLLQADLGVPVTTFRTGHLVFNAKQPQVMQALGFRSDSSNSAPDQLTNFPFRLHAGMLGTGALTDVLEIPLTISDVLEGWDESEAEIAAKVELWHDVLQRNAANGAPTVLLVHPNRGYKITAQKGLFERMGEDISGTDMESFADFWRAREALVYRCSGIPGGVRIAIPDDRFPLDSRLGIVVEGGQEIAAIEVCREVEAPAGAGLRPRLALEPLPVVRVPWGERDVLLQWGVALSGSRHSESGWKVKTELARLELTLPGATGSGRVEVYRREAGGGGGEVKVAELDAQRLQGGTATVLDYPLAANTRYVYRAVVAGGDGAALLRSAEVTL